VGEAVNVQKLGLRQRQMLGQMMLHDRWPHKLRGNEYNVMKSLEKRDLVYRDPEGVWRPTDPLREHAQAQRPGREPGQRGNDGNEGEATD
jgi:hypothetical protein